MSAGALRTTRRGVVAMVTSALAATMLAACGSDRAAPARAVTAAKRARRTLATNTTASSAYRFVRKPLVQGLPDDGPPTNLGGGTGAEVYVHLNRDPPGTGTSCALLVDGVRGEECDRHRPLHGAPGVCLHAYLEMKPADPIYHKGEGDMVYVRLDLDKGRRRIVAWVRAHGRSPESVANRRVRRFGCPL